MQKVILTPFLLIIACLSAGLYGVFHNQISYTVSPEYFHKFKFIQFAISDALPGRIGVSIVGWEASWWMGILIGIPIIPTGMILPGRKVFFTKVIHSFAVVAMTTFFVGFTALLSSFVLISEGDLLLEWCPEEIVDKVAFTRAGMMHSFSYLGGLLGILSGIIYLILAKLRRAIVT
jgi:hypothetical protein